MDDPLVMATLLPHHLMLQSPRLRWTLCATNQCFSNAAVSAFFHCVKVLPVKRGGGIQQEVSILLSVLISVRNPERVHNSHACSHSTRNKDESKVQELV